MNITTGLYARFKGDSVIWGIVMVLSMFSLLLIYSSTETLAFRKQSGDTEFYLIKQFIFLVSGLSLMYLFHLVNYMRYSKLAIIGLLSTIPLLLFTLMIGSNINDASRWISIPFVGLSFQTSDLAKLTLILYVAKQLSSMQEKGINAAVGNFWAVFIPIIVVCGLIAPANLSTAAIIFATCLALMFIGRIHMQNMWYLLLMAVGLFAAMVVLGDIFPESVRIDTWIARLRNFFLESGDESGLTQVNQAKIAISKGGLFGAGPGNSSQANFLTHAYSDYVYSVVFEEYGLFGALVILMLYLGLLYRCVRMVTKSPKAFGSLLALGLCLMLVLQALAHMAVNVNLVPVTGLTLPLISLGGTSLLFTCISIGIILSVSKNIELSNDH